MTRQNVVRNAGQLSNMLETVLYLFVLWRGQNGKKKKETSETMEKQTIHYPRMGYSGKVLTGSGKNDKNNIIGSSVSWGVTRRYRGKESLRRTGLPKTKHLVKRLGDTLCWNTGDAVFWIRIHSSRQLLHFRFGLRNTPRATKGLSPRTYPPAMLFLTSSGGLVSDAFTWTLKRNRWCASMCFSLV